MSAWPPQASRSRATATSAVWGSVESPGRTVEDLAARHDVSARVRQQPQHLETAGRDRQDVAVEQGDRAADLQPPRARGDGRRLGLLVVADQACGPARRADRARGRAASIPRSCSGLAVTGPTAAATMQPDGEPGQQPVADALRRRRRPARRAAPGAEVKTTASISPSAAAATRRRPGPPGRAAAPSGRRRGSHVGAGRGELGVEAVGARAVVLHRDPVPGDALGQQQVEDLGGRLGLGHPVGLQPGGLDRAARLGPAGDDAGACASTSMQLVGEARGVGRLDPAAEPDARS